MLDSKFGRCLPPQSYGASAAVRDWEKIYSPQSLSVLSSSSAPRLKSFIESVEQGWRLGRVLAGDVAILWVVDVDGNVLFAVEELFLDGGASGIPKHRTCALHSTAQKLGHPALVECLPARIAGEIIFDVSTNSPMWIINNKSGRYGIHQNRTEDHLNNVLKIFDKFGITLHSMFIDAA